MRTILIKTLLCWFSLLFISCDKEIDLGYPSNISFSKGGGEKIIAGDQPFTSALIQDYKGNQGSIEGGEDGKLYNVYDWLRVEYVELYNEKLIVYAAPNTTDSKRTLYIELYSGQEYQIVKVTQN
jgi:hypothetical protein